jgi:hypothetical protein
VTDNSAATADNARLVYEQVCQSYRAVDDFRMKLLGLLPLASGGGIILLVQVVRVESRPFVLPLGLFGFLIAFGLFLFEIYGIKKCHALIKAGQALEARLVSGQFAGRPPAAWKFANEPIAAGVIYPAVMAAWCYVALVFATDRAVCLAATATVFVAGLVSTVAYERYLRRDRSG